MFCGCAREERRLAPPPLPNSPRDRRRAVPEERIYASAAEEEEEEVKEEPRISAEVGIGVREVSAEYQIVDDESKSGELESRDECINYWWLALAALLVVVAWIVRRSILREIALLWAGFAFGAVRVGGRHTNLKKPEGKVMKAGKQRELQGSTSIEVDEDAPTRDELVCLRLKKAVEFLHMSAEDPGGQGWIRWGTRRDVELWFQTDKSTGVKHSLGIAEIDAPHELVAKALESEECKRVYDGQWRRTTNLRQLDNVQVEKCLEMMSVRNACVRRDEYNGVFPAKARDAVVVYARYDKKKNHETALCLASICPQDNARDAAHAFDDSNYVRMHIDCGGYLCQPIGLHRTRVVSVVVLDPKGLVPTPVVNFVAMDRPMSLARLRTLHPIKNYVPTDKSPSAPEEEPKHEEDTRNSEEANEHSSEIFEVAADKLEEMLALDAEPTSHGFHKTSNDDDPLAVFFRRQKGHDGIVHISVISRSLIHASTTALHDAVEPGAPKLDKNRADTTVLAEFGKANDFIDQEKFRLVAPIRCLYIRYKSIMLTAPRDALIAMVEVATKDNIRARISFSIDHLQLASSPTITNAIRQQVQTDPKSNFVRMHVHLNGFLFRSTSTPHKTLSTNFALLDPSGGLPNRVRERLAKARLKQLPILSSLVN